MPLLATAALVVILSGLLGSSGTPRASGALGAEGEPVAQGDVSVPARSVVMLGSSPADPSLPADEYETWGIGELGSTDASAIVRYTRAGGWSLTPAITAGGAVLSGFKPAPSPLTGETTQAGSGVLVGTNGKHDIVLVRSPGEPFKETEVVPPELLKPEGQPEQSLYATHRAPLLAALDEGAEAGALVVPVSGGSSGFENGVLHWEGAARKWTREAIEVPGSPQEGMRVLAIGASSPSNAWLLAQLSSSSSGVSLFRRRPAVGGKPASWQPVVVAPGGEPGEALTVPTVEREGAHGPRTVPFAVPGAPDQVEAQILTVTAEGVWIDGERSDDSASTTMFFRPEGELDSGRVDASWCNAPSSPEECTHPLPLLPSEAVVNGPSRSFAWTGSPSPFGQRVITGLPEGVSLRLEASGEFARVLSLGGSEPSNDVGGTHGAAFSSSREGWLGNEAVPVHMTMTPAPNRLTTWPVPFRHALTAIAPQPGAPVGSLESEALAVGDLGEVARYIPHEGWEPESLLSGSGRRETPRLRAVAWPTANRAYAVGELGQMWLWRGETGLWEPDPAAPVSFRGNLLGIAFEPGNPSRGYAVGQQGVLLRYGKTWTQEALPPELEKASFTSIAFAGSEALAAFRVAHVEGGSQGLTAYYTGGLLVNEGSGWRVENAVTQSLGAKGVPWAVAGLPDGGAAISGENEAGESAVLERSAPGGSWQPTPAPYPDVEPGSLALFREGGALRAVGAGQPSASLAVDSALPPPAGFPPTLIQPYPLILEEGHDPVLRQTATGWSDEEHDFSGVRDPLGEYKTYDMVDQPDPISAVLVGPTGEPGWAIGGVVDLNEGGSLDTADVARYREEGAAPQVEKAPVTVPANLATFAIGGNAQCEAPCADRANAGIGPDTWLSTALRRAGEVQGGVRAFLYTGPRVSTGEGHGLFQVPYPHEFSRYAELLRTSTLPAFAAPSVTDREGIPTEGNARSACGFEEAFGGFPEPFGGGPPPAGIASAGNGRGGGCAGGTEPGYYALRSTGTAGPVRVIVLEDGTQVGEAQLTWLSQQLEQAATEHEPAIVVGTADLNNPQITGAGRAREILGREKDGASAYFYDSPEENVRGFLVAGAQREVPTFGSGTLGYIRGREEQNFIGHSGFLLGEVNFGTYNVGAYAGTDRAEVTAQLIPVIGELALEAQDGVLLQRSQTALFDALARRPRAGGVAERDNDKSRSGVYIPIPAECVGSVCESSGILPQYTFRSSKPGVAQFVKRNLAFGNPHQVLTEHGEPVFEPDGASGLLCALNAGETKITIEAGDLKASLMVTVQKGSVRRPCGTVPAEAVSSVEQPVSAPPPQPAPAHVEPAPAAAPPPVPPPPVAAPVAVIPAVLARVKPPPAVPGFFAPPAPVAFVPAFVPLPVPTPGRPTPPSGTSPVTSPVEVAEHQEEEEEATESVSNQAMAYRSDEHEPTPAYILGIVLLAAFAGAGVRRRPRRGRRDLRVAPATISAMRSERRLARGRRRQW